MSSHSVLIKIKFRYQALLCVVGVLSLAALESDSFAFEAKAILAEVGAGSAVIVDVREFAEVRGGMVTGGIWLPTSEISSQTVRYKKILSQLSKKTKIYVYCAVGGRADRFSKSMRAKGFDVINLGGFSTLKSIGFPTNKVSEPVQKKCPWLCGSQK